MNIMVTARLTESPERVRKLAGEDSPRLRFIDKASKACGCTRHRYVTVDGEVWLVEEWESPERFEAFFDGTPEFRQLLEEAGFKGYPEDIRLWEPLAGGD